MNQAAGPTPEEIEADHARRVRMTVSCRDTDRLPKVEGAGEILVQPDGTRVQRMHNGLLVLEGGYLGGWTSEIIETLHGHHEPQEEVAFHEVVERIAATEQAPTMIELGSYWAYYSMWFARRTGGRVVDIEPDPEYLEVGRRNFEINGLECTLLPGAVGGVPGGTVEFLAESTGDTVEVPGYTLGSLMEATDLDRVSLVLADIQGFETMLIDNARDVIGAGKIRFMVISTHDLSISGRATTHQDLLSTIDELGGHVVTEHTVGESYSGDGLVVVSFDPQDRDFQVAVSRARYKESYFGELEPRLQGVIDHLDATVELNAKTHALCEDTRHLAEANLARAEAAEAALEEARAKLAERSNDEPTAIERLRVRAASAADALRRRR